MSFTLLCRVSELYLEEKQQPSFSSHCKPQPQCLKAVLVNPLSESGAAQTSPFQESQPFSHFPFEAGLSWCAEGYWTLWTEQSNMHKTQDRQQARPRDPVLLQDQEQNGCRAQWNDSSCSAAAERAIRKAASPAGQPACIYILGALCHDSQTQEIHISSPSSLPHALLWEHQPQAHRSLLRFIPKHY